MLIFYLGDLANVCLFLLVSFQGSHTRVVQQVLWTHLQPVFVADSKRFQARRGQWTGEQSLTELIKDLEDEDSEGSDLVRE